MSILIGLTGLARHGKGAVAAHLVEHHGFVKMSFADEVKAMARRIDPIVDWGHGETYTLTETFEYFDQDEEAVKREVPEYRRFLQRLGTEGVRTIAPTFWIEALKTRIHVHQHDNKVSRIVVDDVRFPNEATMFLDLWQVSRPGYGAVRDLHESEQHVGKLGETLHLKNDGTLGVLGILVDAVVKPMLLQEGKLMAIQEVTTVTATCDLCHKPVDTESTYIDAMAYGATFHLECLQEGSDYSPLQVIKALGLDDIYFRHRAVRGKLIYHFPY